MTAHIDSIGLIVPVRASVLEHLRGALEGFILNLLDGLSLGGKYEGRDQAAGEVFVFYRCIPSEFEGNSARCLAPESGGVKRFNGASGNAAGEHHCVQQPFLAFWGHCSAPAVVERALSHGAGRG
ncbi:hypothetical protein [Cupriavidus pauculus]|uniref:hypothetical protein n=1 Tax=Cupriavidus pauculus TaxID=82633 RepID=UPI001EE2B3AC|nr:hypothetical protein [Cupriavidus pauculus]GJG92861.1 hypothetical protein CBA19C6_00250 [Cupriavidus pauculus]